LSKLEEFLTGIGKGSERKEIASSSILALVTFFYAYTISSVLRLNVIVIRERIVYDNPFDQYIFGSHADSIIISVGIFIWLFIVLRRAKQRYIGCAIYGVLLIAVASAGSPIIHVFSILAFPVVMGMAICSSKTDLLGRKGKVFITNWILYLDYIFLVFLAASVLSIIIFLESFVLSDVREDSLRNYAYEVFVMLTPASVFLMALLVFSFPLKLMARELLVIFPSIKNWYSRLDKAGISKAQGNDNADRRSIDKNETSVIKNFSRERKRILLLLPILALSVTLALIPQHPAMNKDNRLVGVDTGLYVKWINNLEDNYSKGTSEFFRQLFSVQGIDGDRPLSLFIMFTATKVLKAEDIAQTIDFAPILLSPLLVLSVFYLTRQLTSSSTASLLAAFLTTISFHLLIGIFAGFYANWIALIIGYFSLGFLFKFLKDTRKSSLVVFSALLVLTLFAHIYTWTILSLCAGIFLLLLIVLRRTEFSKRAIIFGLIVIGATVVIDISKSLVTRSSSGIIEDMELSDVTMGPGEFARHLDILAFTINSSLGGIFANSVILLLGLYWVLKSDYRKPLTLFMLVFLSIAILPLFFGNWIVQSRILYIIPFQIPASLSLTYILVQANGDKKESGGLTTSFSRALFVAAICAVLSAAAVYVLSNLYLVLPRL
jgi:hypothetical protein